MQLFHEIPRFLACDFGGRGQGGVADVCGVAEGEDAVVDLVTFDAGGGKDAEAVVGLDALEALGGQGDVELVD
jgi:hypothetical protein